MNIYTEGAAVKKRVADALEEWALSVVDSFTSGSPKLTMAGVYIKNGIRNYRKMKEVEIDKMIDDVALFIADKDGEVNFDKVMSDLGQFVDDTQEMSMELGALSATIGNGAIKIHLPNNVFTRMVFGDHNAIVLKEADFRALKALMAG